MKTARDCKTSKIDFEAKTRKPWSDEARESRGNLREPRDGRVWKVKGIDAYTTYNEAKSAFGESKIRS